MEKIITIRPENKKAHELLDRLHAKKMEIKKQIQNSALIEKLRAKSK